MTMSRARARRLEGSRWRRSLLRRRQDGRGVRHQEPTAVLFPEDVGLEYGQAKNLARLQLLPGPRHAHRPRRIALNLNIRPVSLSDFEFRGRREQAFKILPRALPTDVTVLATGSLSMTLAHP
jgi:hypothetical protein